MNIRIMLRMAACAAALIATAATSPIALAQARAPSAQERSAIEAKLTAGGYKGWTKIEFEEGRWKVDAARAADGKAYDVELDGKSLDVVKKELHK